MLAHGHFQHLKVLLTRMPMSRRFLVRMLREDHHYPTWRGADAEERIVDYDSARD